jgi:hypothetical protein
LQREREKKKLSRKFLKFLGCRLFLFFCKTSERDRERGREREREGEGERERERDETPDHYSQKNAF